MAQYIEQFLPPILDSGLNTLENTSLGGTLAVTGATTFSSTLSAAGITSTTTVAATGVVSGAGVTSTGVVSGAGVTSTAGVTSSSATAGNGYATGAGGTVTQITSRSTGVTISKPCGSIQTDTTSLAAGASAVFTVTNTTVAIGDVVSVSIRSGSSNAASITGMTYVSVVAVAAGSFNIAVDNRSAATAEVGAIIINFAVTKAVTA
jgi:hypothetical protein